MVGFECDAGERFDIKFLEERMLERALRIAEIFERRAFLRFGEDAYIYFCMFKLLIDLNRGDRHERTPRVELSHKKFA